MDLVDIDQVLNNLELKVEADENKRISIANQQQVPASASNSVLPSTSSNGSVSGSNQKSFVGVCQVFNSLNDYCKEVDQLETAQSQQQSYDKDCHTQVETANDASNDEDEEDDEDEDDCSNDIQKFTEKVKRLPGQVKQNSNNSISSTDDSLTTSSSSTFSSGPSPGLDSSCSEENCIQREELVNKPNKSEQNIPPPLNFEPTLSEAPTVVLEDLAAGLSSISINTDKSQVDTAATATAEQPTDHSAPNEEEQQLSKQNTEIEEPIAIQDQKLMDTDANVNKSNEQIEIVAAAAAPTPAPQFIAFCATMDDISDTELDSMLQEMDIDAEPSEVLHKHMSEMATGCSTDMNADSFSQASTVEISEIKAPPVMTELKTTEEEIVATNSIASSYTSSESLLEEGPEQIAEENFPKEEEDDESRPQRPTSLEIPSSVKIATNIYANAGQTPPGAVETAASEESIAASNASLDNNSIGEAAGYSDPHENIGRTPPIWVPDNMAAACMMCHAKFTMIKRRHHCRACGKVLCSVCCSQKFKLEFIPLVEASRVCVQCYLILTQRQDRTNNFTASEPQNMTAEHNSSSSIGSTSLRSPNPNNPMEYCSTLPPHEQVGDTSNRPTPTVIVPVGVLKKDTSNSSNSSQSNKSRKRKSVMFSDGIAPGSELASMEHEWGEAKQARRGQQQQQQQANIVSSPKSDSRPSATTLGMVAQLFRGGGASLVPLVAENVSQQQQQHQSPPRSPEKNTAQEETQPQEDIIIDPTQKICRMRLPEAKSLIPLEENALPPIYFCRNEHIAEVEHLDVTNDFDLIQRLQKETLKFVVQNNFYVLVKIVHLKCCMNRTVINFTTLGMHHVGNDEIIILLEYVVPQHKSDMLEPPLPKHIFQYLQQIYKEAELGKPISELSFISPKENSGNFLGSSEYGGFMFIRPTFQCLQEVIVPENPYLIGILINRCEVPWAKIFPLRLMLRLGAQFRYYPCPHISIRNRDSVYAEIAETIMNFLADFQNYSYTLPRIRGLTIHMEEKQTTVMIPRNRLDDIIMAINNSTSDNLVAFGGNFSKKADGHLVCMQNVNDEQNEMYSYSTQAINIQGQPRKVTGASFLVLNEALESNSGLSAKCSIVEDGLMVQVMPEKMKQILNALHGHKNIDVVCGPINADPKNTEVVSFKWVDNERDFNMGVKSPIDSHSLQGISSMRVHVSFNYAKNKHMIRLTDIFIYEHEPWYAAINGPLHSSLTATQHQVTHVADQIARSASMALVPFLDLLAASGSLKIGLRVTLHADNVCYEAGARGHKLPPLYMKALDDHLIPTLHKESMNITNTMTLELIFYILDV